MKKIIVLTLLSCIFNTPIISNDSLQIVSLQREVSNLRASVSRLQKENIKMYDLYQQQGAKIDSLYRLQTNDLNTKTNKLDGDLKNANKKIDDNTTILSDSINSRTWMSLCGILVALALLGIAYYILRKKICRGSSSVNKIKTAQEKLEEAQKAMQEEAVTLDNKLVDLLNKQIEVKPISNNNNNQPDHSLALKVADEIVRIETNLSRMDESIKGYKQLKKAVDRIRTNFLANGYEIVEMLGKPYNEGMKASVNFETDDNLADGEQIITGIIKPQINYKGKMIQTAQITVSQNI